MTARRMINNTIKYIFSEHSKADQSKQTNFRFTIDLQISADTFRFRILYQTKSKPKFIEDFRAQKLGEPLIITSILHDLEEISDDIRDRFQLSRSKSSLFCIHNSPQCIVQYSPPHFYFTVSSPATVKSPFNSLNPRTKSFIRPFSNR